VVYCCRRRCRRRSRRCCYRSLTESRTTLSLPVEDAAAPGANTSASVGMDMPLIADVNRREIAEVQTRAGQSLERDWRSEDAASVIVNGRTTLAPLRMNRLAPGPWMVTGSLMTSEPMVVVRSTVSAY